MEWGFTRAHFEEIAARVRPTIESPFGGWAPRGAMFFERGIAAEVRHLAGSQLRHATLQSLGVRSSDPIDVPDPPSPERGIDGSDLGL